MPSDSMTLGKTFASKQEIDTGLPIFRGTHRRTGILAAWGEGVRSGASELTNLSLMDVAPTILYALGSPIPLAIDGRVLSELFLQTYEPSYEESDVSEQVAAAKADSEDQQAVLDRLKGLGYID